MVDVIAVLLLYGIGYKDYSCTWGVPAVTTDCVEAAEQNHGTGRLNGA